MSIRILTKSLPDGYVGRTYLCPLVAETEPAAKVFWRMNTDLPRYLFLREDDPAIMGLCQAQYFGTVQLVAINEDTGSLDTATFEFRIAPEPQIEIKPAHPVAGRVGEPYEQSFDAKGGVPPYVWTVSGLPAGLAFERQAIIGTPAQAGTFYPELAVHDSATPPARMDVYTPLAIGEKSADPLEIRTLHLETGQVGDAYHAEFATRGGSPPFHWTVSGFPPGLEQQGGDLSGTPTSAGEFIVQAEVRDSGHPQRTAAAALPVEIVGKPADPLEITTEAMLPAGRVGDYYDVVLAARGGTAPYFWRSPGLPSGLTLDGPLLGGVPMEPGHSFTVHVFVDDSSHPRQTAVRSFVLEITEKQIEPLAITTTQLHAGRVGRNYEATLSATGGTAPYTWTSPDLPKGLVLGVGLLGGVPEKAGDFTVQIDLKDSSNPQRTTSRPLALTLVSPLSEPLEVTTQKLPPGQVGQYYNVSLSAQGGTAPYVWASRDVPNGLTLQGPLLGGVPTEPGNFAINITLRDSTHPHNKISHAMLQVSIAAKPVEPLRITTTQLPAGRVGERYELGVAAQGGTPPYQWKAVELPPGLAMYDEWIAGYPTRAGDYTAHIVLHDSGVPQGATLARIPLAIGANPLAIVTAALPGGRDREPYDAALAAQGGTPPYHWKGVDLPPGLTVNGPSLTGTPQGAGDVVAHIVLHDSGVPQRATFKKFPFSIAANPAVKFEITTTALPAGTVGQHYDVVLSADGGTLPYQWKGVDLPPGLTVNGPSIRGIPNQRGDFTAHLVLHDGGLPQRATFKKLPLRIGDRTLRIGDIFEGGMIYHLGDDGRSGSVITVSDIAVETDWPTASRICDALTRDGYHDWRLPSQLDWAAINAMLIRRGKLQLGHQMYWTADPGDRPGTYRVIDFKRPGYFPIEPGGIKAGLRATRSFTLT